MHLFVYHHILNWEYCTFARIYSCASVCRRLFCGEKPQRSWGKETSISATSRLSPEPSQSMQSSPRCEGHTMNSDRHTPTLHCWTARVVRSAPQFPWTEKCLYTWKHITYPQTPCPHHHFTASQMWAVLLLPSLSPQGLKHTHMQTYKSAEC